MGRGARRNSIYGNDLGLIRQTFSRWGRHSADNCYNRGSRGRNSTGRVPDCLSGGCGFESRRPRFIIYSRCSRVGRPVLYTYIFHRGREWRLFYIPGSGETGRRGVFGQPRRLMSRGRLVCQPANFFEKVSDLVESGLDICR